MASLRMVSISVRRARAPVPIVKAFEATLCSAGVVKRSSMPDREKRVVYCARRELRGSVKIRMRRGWVNADKAAVTGIRPIISGMNP